MILKIRVGNINTGGPIGTGKGFVRYLVVLLLSLPFGIGTILDGLWPLWDDRRQALHDKVVNSAAVDAA